MWLLLRTDRDNPRATDSVTEPGLPQMAAAFCRWAIYQGSLPMGAKHELVSTGPDEWRFGDVRPFKVTSVGRVEPNMPLGTRIADRMRAGDTIPTVVGRQPWYVRVELWWRAGPTTIAYPGVHEGLFGRRWQVDGADWVLDRSVVPRAEHTRDPGSQTWAEAQGDAAEAAIRAAADDLGRMLRPSLGALGLLALAYLFASRK